MIKIVERTAKVGNSSLDFYKEEGKYLLSLHEVHSCDSDFGDTADHNHYP